MSSVALIKKYFWLNKILVLVLLTILCSGCIVKRYKPEMKLVDAYIFTQEKKYPLKLESDLSNEGVKWASHDGYMNVYGKVEDMSFKFGAHVGLFISHRDSEKKIVFNDKDVFYQLNDGKKVKLNAQVEHRVPEKNKYSGYPSGYSSSIRYSLPKPLSDYKFDTIQGGLTPSSIKTIKAGKRNKHRIYIPFTVDGEPYVVDISFKVKLHGDYYVEVPGTP